MHLLRTFLALLLLLSISACSKSTDSAGAPAHHSHQHTAPHGGTVVMLGDEAYHLEFVLDADAGSLTAYVLDAHMENFIRINAPAFEVVAMVGGEKRPLTFRAAANSATGETVGDTSQFTAEADWLKTNPTFSAELTTLTIRGAPFSNVAFEFPAGNQRH